MPESVQPASSADNGGANEGQGGDGPGLYDLESVPQELRPHLEPRLKEIEGNATRRFQQYAEQLKGWEPYQELGLQEYDPEGLQQLLAFSEVLQDEDRFGEWWREVGQRMNLTVDSDDENDLDYEDLTREDVQNIVRESLEEALAPVQETIEQTEAERQEAAAMSHIRSELVALKDQHGLEFDVDDENDDTRESILQLAYSYAEEDPENAVARGFEDYQRITGNGEAGLFANKSAQARVGPEGPGAAATAPQRLTPDQVKAAARERLEQAHAT